MHGGALLATTLIPPHASEPLNDAQEIRDRFEHQIAGVIDAGACPSEPTTVIDLTPMGTGGDAVVTRQGRGDVAALGLYGSRCMLLRAVNRGGQPDGPDQGLRLRQSAR